MRVLERSGATDYFCIMDPTPPTASTSIAGNKVPRTAIAALICGIGGLCLFPLSAVGIIFAISALRKLSRERRQQGRVMAIVAICLAPLTCISGIGVAAAIAIPAFQNYVRRSKTAEAQANIKAIYTAVVAYHREAGALPPSIDRTPPTPGRTKQPWPVDDLGWRALGFTIPDLVYYSYEVTGSASYEGWPETGTQGLTIRALGDLDGDGKLSTFELPVRIDPSTHEVVRAPEILVTNELE